MQWHQMWLGCLCG